MEETKEQLKQRLKRAIDELNNSEFFNISQDTKIYEHFEEMEKHEQGNLVNELEGVMRLIKKYEDGE